MTVESNRRDAIGVLVKIMVFESLCSIESLKFPELFMILSAGSREIMVDSIER